MQDRLRAVAGLAHAGQHRLAGWGEVSAVLMEDARLAQAPALRAVGIGIGPGVEDAGVVRVERLQATVVAVEQLGLGQLAMVLAAVAVAAVDALEFNDLGGVGGGDEGELLDDVVGGEA